MTSKVSGVAVFVLLAVASCSSVDPPSRTCQSLHPRGPGPVAPADVVAQAFTQCSADTGECQGMPPCGNSAGRVCDSSRFMTAEAAICIAQAAGLEPGLQPAGTGLVYDFRFRRVAWGVSNLLYDPAHPTPQDGGSGTSGGHSFQIDAVSGAVLQESNWDRVP
jgi:hypothetical protein